MNRVQIFIAGLCAAILVTLLYAIEGYALGIFSGAPSVPVVSLVGSSWMIFFVCSIAVVGILLALLYTLLSRGFRGSRMVRGMKFGVCMWLGGTALYLPLVYINVSLPAWLVLSWMVGLFVNIVVAGGVIGLLVDVRE